jgi:hypothetical protein
MNTSVPPDAGRIFISYRRDDSAFPAGWLYDRLAGHFGDARVFKDIDSIQLGDDFTEAIRAAIGSCAVLLALIGARWLTVTDDHGRRRLDDPEDFVRLEIEAALAREVRVIPVVMEGARMPSAADLPSSLRELAGRQALELRPNRFRSDTGHLLKVLDEIVVQRPGAAGPPGGGDGTRAWPRKARWAAVAALAAAVIAGSIYATLPSASSAGPGGGTHGGGTRSAGQALRGITLSSGHASPTPSGDLSQPTPSHAAPTSNPVSTTSGSAGSLRIQLGEACQWAYPGQATGQTSGSGGSVARLGANGQIVGRFINGHSLDAWCQDPSHTDGRHMSGATLADGVWVCIP